MHSSPNPSKGPTRTLPCLTFDDEVNRPIDELRALGPCRIRNQRGGIVVDNDTVRGAEPGGVR